VTVTSGQGLELRPSRQYEVQSKPVGQVFDLMVCPAGLVLIEHCSALAVMAHPRHQVPRARTADSEVREETGLDVEPGSGAYREDKGNLARPLEVKHDSTAAISRRATGRGKSAGHEQSVSNGVVFGRPQRNVRRLPIRCLAHRSVQQR
jgi:hypothetical protein